MNMLDQTNSLRSLRLAAVQVQARLGETAKNPEHFTLLIGQAAQQAAQLVVLPERAACGYSMSRRVWNTVERRDGSTVQWLHEISMRSFMD
jgi:predicted amidohydrolase